MNFISEENYAVALASVISALLIPVAASINRYTSFADRTYGAQIENTPPVTTGETMAMPSPLSATSGNATGGQSIEIINVFLRPTWISALNVFWASFVSYGAFAVISCIFIGLALRMRLKATSLMIEMVLIWQAVVSLSLVANTVFVFIDAMIPISRLDYDLDGIGRFYIFLVGFLVNVVFSCVYLGCILTKIPCMRRLRHPNRAPVQSANTPISITVDRARIEANVVRFPRKLASRTNLMPTPQKPLGVYS